MGHHSARAQWSNTAQLMAGRKLNAAEHQREGAREQCGPQGQTSMTLDIPQSGLYWPLVFLCRVVCEGKQP